MIHRWLVFDNKLAVAIKDSKIYQTIRIKKNNNSKKKDKLDDQTDQEINGKGGNEKQINYQLLCVITR